MKINLDVAALKTSEKESKRGLKHHCRTSLPRLLLAALALFVVTLTLYLCKRYIRAVLYWLENQDSVVVSATIVILFVVVSFPLSVGYIVVVGASGYLFGLLRGFVLSVIGANVGLVMAHNVLKLVGHHEKVRRLIERDTAAAIVRVISGPLCFKIVFCSRLTPIPFGLQNAIFAVVERRRRQSLPLGFSDRTIGGAIRGGVRRFHAQVDAGRAGEQALLDGHLRVCRIADSVGGRPDRLVRREGESRTAEGHQRCREQASGQGEAPDRIQCRLTKFKPDLIVPVN